MLIPILLYISILLISLALPTIIRLTSIEERYEHKTHLIIMTLFEYLVGFMVNFFLIYGVNMTNIVPSIDYGISYCLFLIFFNLISLLLMYGKIEKKCS